MAIHKDGFHRCFVPTEIEPHGYGTVAPYRTRGNRAGLAAPATAILRATEAYSKTLISTLECGVQEGFKYSGQRLANTTLLRSANTTRKLAGATTTLASGAASPAIALATAITNALMHMPATPHSAYSPKMRGCNLPVLCASNTRQMESR